MSQPARCVLAWNLFEARMEKLLPIYYQGKAQHQMLPPCRRSSSRIRWSPFTIRDVTGITLENPILQYIRKRTTTHASRRFLKCKAQLYMWVVLIHLDSCFRLMAVRNAGKHNQYQIDTMTITHHNNYNSNLDESKMVHKVQVFLKSNGQFGNILDLPN